MKGIVFLALTIIIVSCATQQKVETVEELQSFVRDQSNGLFHERMIDGVNVRVQYQPDEVIASRFGKSINKEQRSFIDKHLYFLVDFSNYEQDLLTASRGGDGYMELLEKLSFRMGEFVFLTGKKGKVLPVDAQFSRLFGVSNSSSVLLVFEQEEVPEDEFDLVLKEFGLGIGTHKFNFKKQDMSELPEMVVANL